MWRNTALVVRIGPIDARVIFLWAFAVLGFEVWKLAIAVVATVFFKVSEFYGYTPMASFRAIRFLICGTNRPALPRMEYRKYA